MFPGPSNTAGKVDDAFLFIVVCCVILLAGVTITMIVFLVRYNRDRHKKPERVRENVALEIAWTVIPTILVLVMFYIGWADFGYIRNPPKDALAIDVTARQWSWLFEYTTGKQSDVLYVPQGRPVKLVLTSADVIHSLFIPAFRIKEDCVPGMKTHLWFTADETGTYDLFCTEYCGLGHSHMRSKVNVLTAENFAQWLNTPEGKTPADLGPKILQAKGCLGCHSLDGSVKVGPTFKSLLGRKQTVIAGGAEREVIVDAAYLRKHILEPEATTVKGYPPIMPKVPLTDSDLSTIIAYLETIK
ncbi:MAG: cytochrome c oxidase subunit II [Deltaproteobacteria bacterium]|nr:cytochrome c oxidase subunit II [Deltaproteobacteria bacterium]